MNWLLATLLGYLLGSIPFGFLLGRMRGVDIRQFGSGATGGTNVLRTLGVAPGILTFTTDLLKGVAGAYFGGLLAGEVGAALGGLAAVVGHSYSVWLGFKGGKSVATGCGSLLLIHPLGVLAGLVAAIVAIVPTRYVSLGSLVGALVAAGIIAADPNMPVAYKLHAAGTFLVIYIRHWENMKRLVAGTENKIGQKAKPRQGA